MSTSVLKVLPGKLDIKRHSSSILYICGIFRHSVPPAMGYIRHFRACRKSNLKQCMNQTDTPRVVDTEVAEWSTKIAASVANVRKKVLGL